MVRLITIIGLICVLSSVAANYEGPYLIWGPDGLKNLKSIGVGPIDEASVNKLYEDAKSIIIFVKNDSIRLTEENFPTLKKLIDKSNWIYLADEMLPLEPQNNNFNVEIINLSGSIVEQDLEISALYKDSEGIFGKGNVLAILANQLHPHTLYKREAEVSTESSTVADLSSPVEPPTEEPMKEDFIYVANEKAILYTTAAPILETEVDEKTVTKELKAHGLVQVDTRNNSSRLIVTFTTDDKQSKTTLRFRFPIVGSYWYLNSVEVEEKDYYDILSVEGETPSAPIGFSYKCSHPLTFRNGSNSLKLQSIQVQPLLDGVNRFGDAYDCVGFTTAPIWAGIFVSFIVILGTFIGILAIMDIKTPNRFESSRSKQLTFTTQE